MRKLILCFLMMCNAWLFAQNPIQVQLISQENLLSTAQTLGKIVFVDGKMQIYDLEGNLIAEPEYTEEMTIEVSAATSTVTITSGSGEEQTISVEMGIEQITLRDLQNGSFFRLYTLNGQLLKQGTFVGETTIFLQDMPAGNYLLVVNNNILKLMKP